jgi:hypothetical protein
MNKKRFREKKIWMMHWWVLGHSSWWRCSDLVKEMGQGDCISKYPAEKMKTQR